jgi:hypothetical protein
LHNCGCNYIAHKWVYFSLGEWRAERNAALVTSESEIMDVCIFLAAATQQRNACFNIQLVKREKHANRESANVHMSHIHTPLAELYILVSRQW